MNWKTKKFLIKGTASILVSALLGYAYKQGQKLEQRIDDYFVEDNYVETDN